MTPADTPRPGSGGAGAPERVELTYRLDGPSPGSVRVHVGAEIVITLEQAPGHAWTAVESLQPRVMTVQRSSEEAAVTTVARAVAAGNAQLRWASSFTGDPFGPPTKLWQLTVTVVA